MPIGQRILIVDDEEDIRAGVSQWFKHAGYETSTAADGEEGMALASQDPPDGILLDMLMPKKNGMTMLSELRAQRSTVDIPVVMLSASLRDEQLALDAGARFFIHKPFSGRQVVHAVKTAISQRLQSTSVGHPPTSTFRNAETSL